MKTIAWLAAVLVAGCVTPAATHQSTGRVDFTQFRTVAYSVHPMPATEYGEDHTYGDETIDLFHTLLGKKLKAMGYELAQAGAPSDLSIDIAVSAAKPGSAATRFWVGFGAGRALLLFDATFTNAAGANLASFQGGRSHTGMEFNESFANKDQIQTFAALASVDQIERFMTNGGAFPEKKK